MSIRQAIRFSLPLVVTSTILHFASGCGSSQRSPSGQNVIDPVQVGLLNGVYACKRAGFRSLSCLSNGILGLADDYTLTVSDNTVQTDTGFSCSPTQWDGSSLNCKLSCSDDPTNPTIYSLTRTSDQTFAAGIASDGAAAAICSKVSASDAGSDAADAGGDAFEAGDAASDGSTSSLFASFTEMGNQAVKTLENTFYQGSGHWHVEASASGGTGGTTSVDWGVDSMIYALYVHWLTTHGASVPPIMAAMQSTSKNYNGTTSSWSDVPMWDSIADSREYEVLNATHQTGLAATALARAQAAFDFVDNDLSGASFGSGACPKVNYQLPHHGGGGLKTLETDSNYIKAAIVLYDMMGNSTYLQKAKDKYAAVRTYFLDPALALYTVYLFDDGSKCTQVARQFFSSVNGNMLWNSYRLGELTGNAQYTSDAIATLDAIVSNLSDATGVFESLQQDNDSSEELVEAMWTLAKSGNPSLAPTATQWIHVNAAAAAASITANGLYNRFFGGIPPLVENAVSGQPTEVSAWQAAGGLALAIAASDVDGAAVPNTTYWQGTAFTQHALTVTESNAPQSFQFTGEAISIVGTMGLSGPNGGGHVHVSLDGRPLVNEIGIDQAYSLTGKHENTVLFAWRWPTAGTHTLEFSGAPCNVKQGCTFLNMTGYYAR